MRIPGSVLIFAVSIPVLAQLADPLDLKAKLHYHAKSVYSPGSLAKSAASAGILEARGVPEEWGENAYGKRLASTLGRSAIRATLAFGLDSTLHQDPRYFRSNSTGFRRRIGHALRGTILTHTDSGGETLSTWRLGSRYGAAFLSRQWYPDRLNTVSQSLQQGSLQLGFDFASNLGSEFWPDVKRKLLHRKP